MPPTGKKRSVSQQIQLQQARENSSANKTDLEAALASCRDELTEALLEIDALKLELSRERERNAKLTKLLDDSQEKNKDLSSRVLLAENRQKDTYKDLRNERRTRQRAIHRRNFLNECIDELKDAQFEQIKEMRLLEKSHKIAAKKVNKFILDQQQLQSTFDQTVGKYKAELKLNHDNMRREKVQFKAEIYNLKKKVGRAQQTQKNAVNRAKALTSKEKSTFFLLKKGVYSEETRNLVRILVEANVSNVHIMGVIEAVLATAGIKAVGRLSARTISRIVKEGYIAACIQLGYEMQVAEAITLSADGTGHKNINYNSRHANYKINDSCGKKTQVTRFLGIERSLDGSSEQAIQDWDNQLQKIFDIANKSPFSKTNDTFTRLIETYAKLVGMHSDHCAKEKKDANLMKAKKMDATEQLLGENRILNDSADELWPHYLAANNEKIKNAGGQSAWNQLSQLEQDEHNTQMLANLTINLGKDSFDKLSGKEKSIFNLFVWVGCGCHKDLNTVLGGYTALSRFWEENELTPPILLPNIINAAIIQEKSSAGDESSDVARHAVQNSKRGAIKASKIAGDILNNKNDKSGHHDQFRIWWNDKNGTNFTFPDTSNTRFQSHCEAAAVLTTYHDQFLEYLRYAEQRKAVARYSHMEKNLVNALNDIPTRTELAVLALYAQAVSHPYMKTIRETPSLNALDLGPLNKKIESFMRKIIEDPTFLIGENVTFETGTFNGQPWHSKEVVEKINQLTPDIPYLKEALIAFFKGALETWKRFTSEYSPGGLIDEATQEEKDLAWMPTTNDVNEGALGQFRVMMRRQPQLTLLQFNARTMYGRNKTADFMKENFGEDTLKYIREVSRERDTSEKDRKRQILKHAEENIVKKKAAKEKRAENAIKKAARISQTKLEFDKEKIKKTKGPELRDLVTAFKIAGAPNLDGINSKSKVPELKSALCDTIDLFNAGEWQLQGSELTEENDEKSGEDDDESGEEYLSNDDGDSAWEYE